MPVRKYFASFAELGKKPFWSLLRARYAPAYMAMMQANLLDETEPVPASRLYNRLAKDLERLRPYHDIEHSAQRLVTEWLRDGYLTRRRPQDYDEDVYELVPDVAAALRFMAGYETRQGGLTESRLHTVLRQIRLLAEETNPTANARIQGLLAERQRIERELSRLESGGYQPLNSARAQERLREIYVLTERLPEDFLSLRNEFDRLHRNLREQIIAPHGGARGDVLTQVFSGADVIAESDAGRSFDAFWRLLTDPQESAAVEAALEELGERSFVQEAAPELAAFLEQFTEMLLERAGRVHETMDHFARSLRQFVQSRMYQEQRQIQEALAAARQQALAAKEVVKLDYKLEPLPLSSIIRYTVGQWKLRDPAEITTGADIFRAATGQMTPEALAHELNLSDIHWDALEDAVDKTLEKGLLATSIGMVLESFPPRQGLASVVGLVAIACRRKAHLHAQATEKIRWNDDGVCKTAIIPLFYFDRKESHE